MRAQQAHWRLAYARAFDAISDEQDAKYSARSFVRWVRLETTAPRNSELKSRYPDDAP